MWSLWTWSGLKSYCGYTRPCILSNKKESIHSVHIPITLTLYFINLNIKCYEFSIHLLISLHVPKLIVFARLRYPFGKRAQGSNPKVTVEYSIKPWLELSKTRGRKKAGGYVNVPVTPLTPSTQVWSLAHQRFRKIFVRFLSWGSKSKLCKCHSEMSRIFRKNVWTVWCQTVKRIMWFPIKLQKR